MAVKRCIHCRKKLRAGEVMVCLSCSLDDATEMAETEARKMQERRRKRLFVTFVVLFVVLFVSAVVVFAFVFFGRKQRGNGSSDEPVQMRATPPTSIRAPSVSHEITLPHGMNTMLVRGNASIVAEPVARGESMIESPDALDNDLITVVFSDVIRDRARDFFWAVSIHR